MIENLKNIGEAAAADYEDHWQRAFELASSRENVEHPERSKARGITLSEEAARILLGRVEGYYEDQFLDSRQFLDTYRQELYDLALIEAHLDGVTINVRQPLEIGQKVDASSSTK